MKNYRTAEPGDVKCGDCKHVRKPRIRGEWWRCYWGVDHVYPYSPEAISQYKTCNYATPEDDR